jgi:hypothetical protein
LSSSKPGAASRRLPSKKTGQGAHDQVLRGDDLYPTPPELTRALLTVEGLVGFQGDAIWEPAAGKGDMAAVLVEAGHTVFCSDKIDYGIRPVGMKIQIRDFFEFKKPMGGATCIITNPPFAVAGRFVRHALTLCPKVYVLCRLAFLEGSRRSDILDHSLARIWVFVERPPMMHRWSQNDRGIWQEWTGKKAESAMPFAWFCFESGHNGARDGIQVRRLSWHASREKT